MGKLAIEKEMRESQYLKYLSLSSPAHSLSHQVQHLLRFIRDHAPTAQLRGCFNVRITFHISRLITLLFCLLLPIANLVAQDDPTPPADENQSETEPAETPAEPPAETPPETPSEPATPEKVATERLDPEKMTPEKGMLIGDGDSMAMVNNLVRIHGNGLIKFEDVVLYADHIWADFDENIMRASGNVRLIVGNEKTFADELIYNLETKKGIVRNGYTYNDPWYYRGTEIFKIEAEESYVRAGSLTTCSLKHPHYYFTASQIIVRIDKELIAKNIVLKVGGIPLFYFPVYRRDLRKDKVAKIIVKVGTDSYQGQFLSIILPLVRRKRYDAALLYDESTRRGSGYGFDSRYRVNDAKYQEIIVPIPPNPSPTIKTKLQEKAEELSDRLEGEYDKYKLRQIFLPYKITDADIEKARKEVEELYQQLQAPDADFSQLAQNQSDHQETRYQGGDLGFLVPGEQDDEGKRRLEPVLEEAIFQQQEQLQQGALSEILRTELTFHILKVERVLDVYGEREIQIRRIDIAIEPSTETRDTVRETAEALQERAVAGESFQQLVAENPLAEVSELNNGEGMPLNEMDTRWRYSVRRLEQPGETTIPVFTDRGIYIFQLIEKEPTPTFEQVARQFELEWPTLKNEIWDTEKQEDETEGGEDGTDRDKVEENQTESADTDDETEEGDEEEEEEEIKVYEKHGYRGSWESPSAVATQARRLVRGEFSRVLKTRTAHRIIKIDKKRTYRGDFLLLAQDQYSFSRQNAFKTGQRWTMRWGHNQSIYTPWDNPTAGRRPINVMGRVEWQARLFKEGLGTSESTVDSFALFTWGSALSADDTEDTDRDGNLKFSTKTVGDFLSRLQISHSLDLEGEGTSRLQKLPEFTMSFSRMRMDGLPVFKTVNAGLIKVSEKFQTDLPILSVFRIPTLRGSSFDLDVALSNLFRKNYRDYQRNREEQNVFLQTIDLGFDVRKQSTLQLTRNRELRVDLDFGTDVIWHDRDQVGNKSIIRGVYDVRMSAHNTLFRIYDISFIPGARRMRHQIDSTLIFNFQPPVDRDENLYPFGGSTYFYEQKRLNYTFRSSVEIKTRRNKSPHRIFDFDTRVGVDFTEDDPERSSFSRRRRKYDLIDSDLTFTPLPSRNMNLTMRATHDPNPDEDDGKRFKMVGFRSNMSYRRKLWDISAGSSYSNIYSASRRINASWRYRPNQRLEFNFRVIYDWIEKQFYSQSLTLRRNLHDWNMTLSWHRIGIKRTDAVSFGGGVRQDFTFQINLIAEPAASVGLGYDATTDTWGFRSLPAGVPYNAFSAGNTLGRSYF